MICTLHSQARITQGIFSPARSIHWGVPDGTRDENGDLVHDDLLISAALASVLDGQVWGTAQSELISPVDPLAEMEPVF